MKVKVLGKYGPYGKAGTGAASGYLVFEDDFKMLLDMGSGVLSRLLASTELSALDGIFISHLHFDHTSDLLPFKYCMDVYGKPITIYTEKSDGVWYDILFDHPLFNVINIDENSRIYIKGKELTFYRMKHPVPDLAIKIKGNQTFAYTGDTIYNKNLLPLLDSCDMAVCDCSKPIGFKGPHMNISDAQRLLDETNVKHLLASHVSPDYEPIAECTGIPRLTLCQEGETYGD